MEDKKQMTTKSKLVIAIFIFLIAAGSAAVLFVRQTLQPVPSSPEPHRITIAPGTGSARIAAMLEQAGLIRNAQAFTYYLKWKEQGSKFQAGEYELHPGMTLDEIIAAFNQGLVVKEEGTKVTIPEGFTVRQTADKIHQQFGVDPAVFLQTAQQYKQFTAKSFAQIPNDAQLKNRLEGYLFPETYEWTPDTKPEDMLDRMMLELDKKLESLPASWQQTLTDRKLTFHQMMTVASLIEREVAVEEERTLVSGVIYNRLKKGMPLQIDATVQYLFDKPKDRLFEKDLQLESPYNTYLHTGLPPGPIASPSLASIQAAIYPAETKYLFYVTKKDGSKGHLFAETYEQHQQNIAASKKNP